MSHGAGCSLHISLREPDRNLLQGHRKTTLKSPLICQGDLHQHLAALQPSLPLYHRAPPLVDPVPEGQDDKGGDWGVMSSWKFSQFGKIFQAVDLCQGGQPCQGEEGGRNPMARRPHHGHCWGLCHKGECSQNLTTVINLYHKVVVPVLGFLFMACYWTYGLLFLGKDMA